MARMTRAAAKHYEQTGEYMPRMESTWPATRRADYINQYINTPASNTGRRDYLRGRYEGAGRDWDNLYGFIKKNYMGKGIKDTVDVGSDMRALKSNPRPYSPRMESNRMPWWMYPAGPASMTAMAIAKDMAVNGEGSLARQYMNAGLGMMAVPVAEVANNGIMMANALGDAYNTVKDYMGPQNVQAQEYYDPTDTYMEEPEPYSVYQR